MKRTDGVTFCITMALAGSFGYLVTREDIFARLLSLVILIALVLNIICAATTENEKWQRKKAQDRLKEEVDFFCECFEKSKKVIEEMIEEMIQVDDLDQEEEVFDETSEERADENKETMQESGGETTEQGNLKKDPRVEFIREIIRKDEMQAQKPFLEKEPNEDSEESSSEEEWKQEEGETLVGEESTKEAEEQQKQELQQDSKEGIEEVSEQDAEGEQLAESEKKE